MTIDQLELSPHNVRQHRPDMLATDAIERSLLASGLMMPLLVHPWKGRSDKWGVFAGGRRWRSFKNLIERGELPRDYPIDVVIRDLSDVALTELSLAENLLRRDLRPYEEYAAVLKAQKRGASPDEIATAIGQEIGWVKGALRLATLAPPLLAALETGKLSVDQAQAFGATEDHAAQTAAWRDLCGNGDMIAIGTTPAQIRTRLKVGDPELQRLLRFVSDEAYRAAGGRFELDLFAAQAEQRGRVADEDVLRRLVDAKLAEILAEWRASTGRDLRFQGKPPQTTWGSADNALLIEPGLADAGRIELPAGDVVGTIEITSAGVADIRFWWASHAAKRGKKPKATPAARSIGVTEGCAIGAAGMQSTRPIAEGAAISGESWNDDRQRADAQLKEQEGLTAEGVQIMRSIRRQILRAAFVDGADDGDLAADYLVWAQLRMHLSSAGRSGMAETAKQVGMQRLASAEPDTTAAEPFLADAAGGRVWTAALTELRRQSFIDGADLPAAFLDYRASPGALKKLATAMVAALAFERSIDADGYRVPLHDELAVQLGLHRPAAVRRYWQPSAAFLDLLPIAERRAIAEPFLEPVAFAGWGKLKSAELTPMVLRVVEGTAPSTRKAMQSAAANWVHPLLAFRPVPTGTPVAPIERAVDWTLSSAAPDDADPDDDRHQANDTLAMAEAAE